MLANSQHQGIVECKQTGCASLDCSLDTRADLVGGSGLEDRKTLTLRIGRGLKFLQRKPRKGRVRVHQHCDHLISRNEVLQDLQPPAHYIARLAGDAGNIPTGLAQALTAPGTSGHGDHAQRCPLSGVKRTLAEGFEVSAALGARCKI